MSDLTDLEICKRIAEIEGVDVREFANNYLLNIDCAFGTRLNISQEFAQCKTIEDYRVVEEDRKQYLYNPLTDDALCFQLMFKHRVYCEPFMLNEKWTCRASSFGNTPGNGYIQHESLNRAICLAIIEAYKDKL